MKLSDHVMRYTLEKLYRGVNSKYAKDLGVDRSNLRKTMENLEQYDESRTRLVDSTLRLYDEMPELLIDALITYGVNGSTPCKHQFVPRRAKELCAKLPDHAVLEKRIDDIRFTALSLITKIEGTYCGINPDNHSVCASYQKANPYQDDEWDEASECPCIPFVTFLKQLADKTVLP